MSFALSKRSLDRLEGIDTELLAVVMLAIKKTKVDFGVVQGLRTVEEQEKLVASGASKTMKSKHLEGKAVDLMAFVDGRSSWELNVYDDIADAMKEAAIELGVPIRWGAAWTVPDICLWPDSMEAAMMSYIDQRRAQGKRPFIDAPHFEVA
jgi:peptidoglycan LD-endopeptidase CwlK